MTEFLRRQTEEPLDETGFEDLDYQSQTHEIYLEPARADRPLVEFQWPAITWNPGMVEPPCVTHFDIYFFAVPR